MPRIDAPTIAEHRALVTNRLVDAAEQIMRTQGVDALTAGEVSTRAGIARNGLYRYVKSIDDLKALVIARHLPTWARAVDESLAGITDPRARILAWAEANLRQAATSGHGWLIALARSREGRPTADSMDDEDLARVHTAMTTVVTEAWSALCPDHHQALVVATNSLLTSGFTMLDTGTPLEEVVTVILGALEAVVDRFTTLNVDARPAPPQP